MFQAIMLLSLTLLALSIVKVYSNFLTNHEKNWEASQVYIYKKSISHGRKEM